MDARSDRGRTRLSLLRCGGTYRAWTAARGPAGSVGVVGVARMKLIIYADPDYFIQAVRAAKNTNKTTQGSILCFEDGSEFYVVRNKTGSITVRQQVPILEDRP